MMNKNKLAAILAAFSMITPSWAESQPDPFKMFKASGEKRIGAAHFEIDADSKSLIVTTDADTNEIIKQMLRQLDQPIAQALINVQFVEVTHTDGLDLGADISYNEIKENGDQSVVSSLFGVSDITSGGTVGIIDGNLTVTLKALAEKTKMEVLSRPSVMTRSNEEATITVGQEVPFIRNSQVMDDGRILNTIEYEDIGIILNVTPTISSDGLVEMVVAPEISTQTGETVSIQEGIDSPTFAKRSAKTTVVVPSGKTVVIGGLMESQETEAIEKVPFLGDIPLLGKLFQRTATYTTKTELLIFLTPSVVNHQQVELPKQVELENAPMIRELIQTSPN